MTREERDAKISEAWERFALADNRQRIADYKKVLSTPEGRRFVMWIKNQAKLEQPLRAHECDAHQLAYRAGMHDIVALIFQSMRSHEPELVFKAEMERSRLETERKSEVNLIFQLKITEE